MNYLHKSENVEIAWMQPQKRTITIELNEVFSNTYFLQFPYLLFVRNHTLLSLFFAKEEIKDNTKLYFPPLPNIFSDDVGVCIEPNRSLEKSIVNFWQTEFYYSDNDDDCCSTYAMFFGREIQNIPTIGGWIGTNLCELYFGGFSNWQELSLDEIMKRIDWDINTNYESIKKRLSL